MAFCLYSQSNSLIRLSPKYTGPITINSYSKSVSVHAVAGDSAMANSVRVAAAQMTSVNDLAANFATCSRLVKVLSIYEILFCIYIYVYTPYTYVYVLL